MKKRFYPDQILVALSGLAAAVLHRVSLTHIDEKGLYISADPTYWGVQLLLAACGAFVLLRLRRQGRGNDRGSNYPPSALRGITGLAAGVLLALHGVMQEGVYVIAAPVAGLCIALDSLPHFKCKGSWPGFACVVNVFFIVNLILSFRGWSSEPQLRAYAVELLACIALELLAYNRAAWAAGLGKRRPTLFFAQAALCLCLCAVGAARPAFYAAGILWAVSACPELGEVEL